MPDGAQVRFPEDMPREEIRALIESKYPDFAAQQQSSAASPEVTAEPAAPAATPYDETLTAQGLSGVTEGAAGLLSLPNTLELGLRNIGPFLVNKIAGRDVVGYQTQSILPNVGETFLHGANEIGAISPPSDNGFNKVARRVGQEVGANVIPALGNMSRAASVGQALARGGSELGLSLASGTGAGIANQISPDNPLADMAGQAVGFGAGALAGNLARRAITPNPTSPQRIAIADALQREGVDLTAGQRTGNKNLQFAESELGANRAGDFTDKQAEQFTSAALDRIGVKAPRATPEVMDKAYKNIGDEFDRLAAASEVPVDRSVGNELQATVDSYTNLLGDSSKAPAVQRYVDEIYEHAANSPAGQPMLSGEQYQSIRSRLGKDMRRTSSPELAEALGDIQHTLDDSVERYLAQAKPDELGAWKDIRRQYKNFIVLEKAASAAGEDAALGIISPARLRSAAAQQSTRGYVRGQGDFAELARNGVAAMTPLPNSGTASRMGARSIVNGVPTIAGTLLGGAAGAGNPLAAVAGGLAGAAVPGQVGRALLSPVGRAYLGNQVLGAGEGLGSNLNNLVARALVAQGGFDQ